MTRRRYILIVGYSTATILAAALTLTLPREPSWNGYPLRSWLQSGYGSGMTHGDSDQDEADEAIRHIGTEALPILIRELGATDSPIRWRLFQFCQNHSVPWFRHEYPDERRSRAVAAFQALRGLAAPALPEIRRYLSDPELKMDAQRAMDAILGTEEEMQPNEPITALGHAQE